MLNRRNFLLCSTAAGFSLLAQPSFAEVRLADVRGREIVLEAPAEKVMLGFYFEDFFAVVGKDAVDHLGALLPSHWSGSRPGQYAAYAERFPQLDEIPSAGDINQGTFSAEAVIAADVDVAILAAFQFDGAQEVVQQIEAAGIPVVLVDFHSQTLENHLASTRILGKVMGREQRAEELAQFYQSMLEDTFARHSKEAERKPRTYIEVGYNGPSEPGNSYAGAMWGGMLDQLGADNIANGRIENWAPLSAEFVLVADPEVIILTGSEWNNRPGSIQMGFGMNDEDAGNDIRAFLRRPGWSDLSAVKSGDIFGIYHAGSRTLSDFAYYRFIGKSLYPEAFADVEPLRELQAYYRKWLPVEAEGSFMFKLQ